MNSKSFLNKSVNVLKENSFRITKPRLYVLEVLNETLKPLSCQDIHDLLSKEGKKVDLVSIYRVLEVLVNLDLIHRDSESSKYFSCSHCDKCPGSMHIFLKCVDCSSVRELDFHGEVFSESFKKRLTTLSSNTTREMLYLSDLCMGCQ